MTITGHLDTTTLDTAAANMNYDRQLVLTSTQPIVRIYTWKNPGITYPEGRPGNSQNWAIDHSDRPTGGGILFHGTHAIVFSIVLPHDCKLFPKSLKEKLELTGRWLSTGLSNAGYPTQPDTHDTTIQNRMYCANYHNPYELRYLDRKVVGMALRRWKQCVLIQGIVHTTNQLNEFTHLDPDLMPYLSPGLGCQPEMIEPIRRNIIDQITPILGLSSQ